MGFNLTNEYIDQTFQQLTQISGSVLVDGTGSAINNLTVTSSFATTASYALNGHVSASYAQFATSASHADNANTASFALNFNPSATASYALFAVSASRADSALTSDSTTEIFVTAKNVQGVAIPKGYAVHSSGVTGENVNITTASYLDSSLMPAIGITQTQINAGAVGEVIITGRLQNINTSNLVAGNPVYVNGEGALTATKPTGSALIQNIGICAKVNATEGEIIVMGAGRSNDVPNITENYLWLGNSNQVATPVASSSIIPTTANTASYVAGANVDGTVASATSASHAVQADSALSSNTSTSASHAVNADTASFLPSTTRLNITDITASNASFTSASIGYLTSITGSAKIIGDAFIIVNNDTPTQRYAGIKVIDSGSTQATASLQFDGQTNDWFYEYTASGDPLNHGVVLFGPEYGTIGSPSYPTANTIQKGNGGHHLLDTNITDDGSTVKINSNTQITGSLKITGSALDASTINGNVKQTFTAPAYGNQATFNEVTSVPSASVVTQYYVNNFSSEYQNAYVTEFWDSFGFNFGTDSIHKQNLFKVNQRISGSTADRYNQFLLRDNNDGTGRIALKAGDTSDLVIQSVDTGITLSGSVDSLNGITAPSFTGSLLGTATTASYVTTAQTASYVNPLTQNVQITGSLNITGSARNASKMYGNLTQQLGSPGLNNQYDLITIPSTTVDGQSYTNVNNFFADYSGFGQNYKDYFGWEYYDSFGYNYGSELAVNGVFVNMSQGLQNSQYGHIRVGKKAPSLIENGRGTVSGSSAELRAGGTGSQVQVLGYNGATVTIQSIGQQGGEAGYVYLLSTGSTTIHTQADSLDLRSGTGFGGYYLNVTGSVNQTVESITIISNTGSLENYKSNFHSLTLVSGSDTHLKMQTTYAGRPGQTISLEVKQPTTATDSYGTLSFSSEFKWAGGTAPTITAASGALDVLTFQTYDGSTYYGTAIQNFS